MPFDPKLLALIDEVDALRNTRNDAWQIPRVEGEFLHQLAVAAGARHIVEIGTSYGFSGLFWAAAARSTGGKLETIDIDPKKVEASRDYFHRAGIDTHVTSHLGDAADVLTRIAAPIDMAFLDGTDKKSCRAWFDLIWPRIDAGGSVLTDNTKTHPAELADYVQYVRSRSDANSIDIPIGNGLEWTLKLQLQP